mmetsp:Transcript_15013/g.48926  ORF Transcript_15013/g.48926 Transcript_15013/m.48926 type:complete len:201 (-) Transcript_15013:1284-1886(-)
MMQIAVICHTYVIRITQKSQCTKMKKRAYVRMSGENCHTYLHAHDRDTRRDSARSAELCFSAREDASAPDQELDLIRGERESDARAHARTRANRVAGAHEGAEFVVVDLAVVVGVHLLEDPLQPGLVEPPLVQGCLDLLAREEARAVDVELVKGVAQLLLLVQLARVHRRGDELLQVQVAAAVDVGLVEERVELLHACED